jgi:serine/threonine-protein kinase
MDKDDVLDQLTNDGFTNVVALQAENEPTDAKPDEVLSIDPPEGSQVPLDTKVTIYYASGMSKVPLVTKLAEDDAVAALRDAGFTNVRVITKEDGTVAAGTVTKQDPPAFTVQKRTTRITLTVAVAPTPPPTESPTATPTESATP